jgi:hypothetical protein
LRENIELARPQGLNLGVIIRPRGFAKSASSERISAASLVRSIAKLGEPPDWTPAPIITWEMGAPLYGRWDRKRRLRVIGYQVFARGDVPAINDQRCQVYRSWAAVIARPHVLLSDPGTLQDFALGQWLPLLEPWQKTVLENDSKT